jgi:GNAT superfamily N-acetyltransferase
LLKLAVEPADFETSALVADVDGEAIGCGGPQRVDAAVAEVRRIYLDRRARGRGLGRTLLAQLEEHAPGLFRSAGYEEIEPFTDGPFTG